MLVGYPRMPAIFRKAPPIEIVLRFIQAFGLKSLDDAGWFSKSHVRLDILEPALIELEPYYMPCKAKVYLYSEMTELRAITILRQVLKVYDISLKTSERGRDNIKTLWYHIETTSTVSDGHVEFN